MNLAVSLPLFFVIPDLELALVIFDEATSALKNAHVDEEVSRMFHHGGRRVLVDVADIGKKQTKIVACPF